MLNVCHYQIKMVLFSQSGLSEFMITKWKIKAETKYQPPPELLNRFYSTKSPYVGKSIFSQRKNKDVMFMKIEDLEPFRSEDRLEYS
jgi:hypothetical protein